MPITRPYDHVVPCTAHGGEFCHLLAGGEHVEIGRCLCVHAQTMSVECPVTTHRMQARANNAVRGISPPRKEIEPRRLKLAPGE